MKALAISSRDNPRLALVRRLVKDPAAYRKAGQVWLEGDHLLRACVVRGWALQEALVAETAWQQPAMRDLALHAGRVLRVPDALFNELSPLPSPAAIGALIDIPAAAPIEAGVATVVLDRLQDAGNVGSILRSAAALGIRQVLALHGSAALWSPKVLRAAMGAHFGLCLREGLHIDDLSAVQLPWIATSSHAVTALHETRLPSPCAWVFGHEGQGVAKALLDGCALTVRIAQPGGEESLNVAAAAAICLHEGLRQGLADSLAARQ